MDLFVGQSNRIKVEIEGKSIEQSGEGGNYSTALRSIGDGKFRKQLHFARCEAATHGGMQFGKPLLPVRVARCVELEFDIKQSALPIMDEGFHVFGENRDALFGRGIEPQLPLEDCLVLSQILCDQCKQEIFFILKMGIKSSPSFARRFGNIL